jgi:hypothetical protein
MVRVTFALGSDEADSMKDMSRVDVAAPASTRAVVWTASPT